MPVDGIVFLVFLSDGGNGKDDSAAATMPRPTTTAHRRWTVNVRCSIHDDAREVLCEKPCARWQVPRHGTGGRQIMPKIIDPRVAHDAVYE